eukprot:TRINITY_DN100462_c0_g1_i1.p1 TRINITY_DN100462_c0_g1~~TRINITY_DN100462_c0_g1_i1.p1  ORF type:complete len:326 (-),score=54.33 TRINITY_DN100462_c0_g1_i1:250-1155(-)
MSERVQFFTFSRHADVMAPMKVFRLPPRASRQVSLIVASLAALCVVFKSRAFGAPRRTDVAAFATTTRLYVVRHGAVIPPGNKEGAIYGGADVDLSERGKEEARAAAEYLLTEAPKLDAIYASNLSRAIYGAERIADGRGLTVKQDPRFTEINRGVWVGMTRDEIHEKFPEHIKQVGSLSNFEADTEFNAHEGESYRAVQRRVFEARKDLLQKHAGETVCLVCHNWVTSALVGDAMSMSVEEWYTLKIPTASVSLIEYGCSGEDTDLSDMTQKICFMGKSPEEFTNGRLKTNVGVALASKG